jgi:hypothetical protein
MRLWFAGKCTKTMPDGEKVWVAWEVAGIFSARELAVSACLSPAYFVAPIDLDVQAPAESAAWPGLEWPYKHTEGNKAEEQET